MQFLHQHCPAANLVARPQDASARRYYQVQSSTARTPMLLMDAPRPQEDVVAFANITRHLHSLNIRAPHIYARDTKHGFLLLEDLGVQTFAKLLKQKYNEAKLYSRAVEVLVALHRHPRALKIELPDYDQELVLEEANLFVDWYLPAVNIKISSHARAAYKKIWCGLLDDLPKQPRCLVLRDFHIDNLMLADGGERVAVLDYQDAVVGSAAYDLVCLLQDARRDLADGLADELFELYCARAGVCRADFTHHFNFWGAHRHFKVAGIFARLNLRDAKKNYLIHMPRVMRMLTAAIAQPQLSSLQDWYAKFCADAHR